MKICPNCGNRSTRYIQTNGERDTSPYLTLLCVAPVAPELSSFDHLPLDQRPVECGMQWMPNDDVRDDDDRNCMDLGDSYREEEF